MHFQSCLVSVLALGAIVVAACGGESDDDNDGTSCLGVCRRQNDLCGDNDDCAELCSTVEEFNTRSGCSAEFQEGLDCLASADVCDDGSTVCPGESFKACVNGFCAQPQNSGDPGCP